MQYTQFLRILKEKVQTCEFGVLEDEMIRDRFVVGKADNDFRRRLLRQQDLTLQKAIDEATSIEETEKQLEKMKMEKEEEKELIRKITRKSEKVNVKQFRECKFCGEKHVFKKKSVQPMKKMYKML